MKIKFVAANSMKPKYWWLTKFFYILPGFSIAITRSSHTSPLERDDFGIHRFTDDGGRSGYSGYRMAQGNMAGVHVYAYWLCFILCLQFIKKDN